MKSTIKVVVLENRFEAVRKAASGPQIQHALMQGGEVIRNWARLNIRKNKLIDTSNLVNSIDVAPSKASSDTAAEVAVGTGVVYAAIHEFGGVINAKAGKFLSWVNKEGKRIFAKSVHIPARPYLRPAVDEHMDEIREAVGIDLMDAIEKATK
jgi:phage gpG-like protein